MTQSQSKTQQNLFLFYKLFFYKPFFILFFLTLRFEYHQIYKKEGQCEQSTTNQP